MNIESSNWPAAASAVARSVEEVWIVRDEAIRMFCQATLGFHGPFCLKMSLNSGSLAR